MRKIWFFLVFLLFLIIFYLRFQSQELFVRENRETLVTAAAGINEKRIVSAFDLDSDGKNEIVYFYSYPESSNNLVDWKTDVFVNDTQKLEFSLSGFFEESIVHDINNDGVKELEIQVLVGKSINSLIYTYQRGRFVRIPVSTEKDPYFHGIVSRNSPEFQDLDNDGVSEMLVYYRHFPPEAKRTVEIYKFDGRSFVKIKEYEEETPEIYL